MGLSVVVPVAKNDYAWKELLKDLEVLSAQDEIIFVTYATIPMKTCENLAKTLNLKCKIQWFKTQKGRAKQMNFGAQRTKNKFIWFLHCDSHFKKEALSALKKNLHENPRAIYFFGLQFLKDGPGGMRLNTLGVYFRSEILKLPFGDQGFCMTKQVFNQLGGFDENAEYGEDHLFIWKAHQNNFRVNCINATIFTSARRYQNQGWFRTTLKHLYLTYKQATPEFIKLIQLRVA